MESIFNSEETVWYWCMISALGVRGFSCAVSGVGHVCMYCEPSEAFPAAVRENKTSGTQGTWLVTVLRKRHFFKWCIRTSFFWACHVLLFLFLIDYPFSYFFIQREIRSWQNLVENLIYSVLTSVMKFLKFIQCTNGKKKKKKTFPYFVCNWYGFYQSQMTVFCN